MNIGPEDKYASVVALLDMMTQCNENTNIETLQQTALLALLLIRDLKISVQLKAA